MTKTEIKKLDNGEVEIIGTMPIEDFTAYKPKAIKNLSANVEVQGFRKGHVPEKVLIQKIGDSAILEEMADLSLRSEYPKIITDNKIDAIGAPQISITKIAKDNPLEFKITVAVMPEVKLADYKAIAKKVSAKKGESTEATDEDIENTISEIKNMRQPAKEGDDKDAERKPIEFNDDFVKTLGDFKDIADFKEKLKKNIGVEKTRKAKDKKRVEIIEGIIKDSKITVPKLLVDHELNKMMAQFKDDVAKSGSTFEEYLTHVKKTEEDMLKAWQTDAEKRAKSQLILNNIAIKEKITAPKDELEKQVKALLEHYKDADPDRVKIHVETVLTNEKVFEFLEK